MTVVNRIDITVPTGWRELDQKQLYYACFLLSSGHYTPDQIKSLCLIRWGRLTQEQLEVLKPEQIAAFLPIMDWLMEIPAAPVCLEKIQGCETQENADFQGLRFEDYLVIEAKYQGYLRHKEISFLNDISRILYGKRLELTATEAYSVFLWVASVKQLFASRFPNFFVPSPVDESKEEDEHALYNRLRAARNLQIRALTKGDITKEKEIYEMDTWRALTELDAQAEEYNELKKQYAKNGK